MNFECDTSKIKIQNSTFPMNIRGLVLNYLHTLQQRGVQRLAVDEESRGILRGWMLAAKRGVPVAPVPVAAAATPAVAVAADSAAAPQPQKAEDAPVSIKLDVNLDEPLPEEPQVQEVEIPFFRPGGSNATEAWENMRRLLPTWAPLRQLGTLRDTLIMPQGCRTADIAFVGDAPGYHDEKAGLPFQGEAGGKLDGMLKAMGLTREQVYLTQLLKFRPAQPRQTLNTRPPSDKELLISRPVVDFEMALVQPRVIVALGVIAARGLLQQGNLPLAAYQERVWDYNGIPVVVTHHPSYLLRTSDLGERRRLWEEMLRVMEMAGLPISDKQRGYFLTK